MIFYSEHKMRITTDNFLPMIFRYLAISILFCFLGFGFGVLFVPPSVIMMANMLIMVISIIMLVLCIFSKKGFIPRSFSMNWVYLYTFIQGILLYPILSYHIGDLGEDVVINVFVATSLIFALFSAYGSKKPSGSYIHWGPFLFIGLIVLLIILLIGVFITQSPIFVIIISVASIIIFCMYILYDINRLKGDIESNHIQSKNDLSIYVLDLYLDFINVFLYILELLSAIKDITED